MTISTSELPYANHTMNYVPKWMQSLPADIQAVIRAARHYDLSEHDRDFHLQMIAIAKMAERLDAYERDELQRELHPHVPTADTENDVEV
jgi:hypothetical protein